MHKPTVHLMNVYFPHYNLPCGFHLRSIYAWSSEAENCPRKTGICDVGKSSGTHNQPLLTCLLLVFERSSLKYICSEERDLTDTLTNDTQTVTAACCVCLINTLHVLGAECVTSVAEK